MRQKKKILLTGGAGLLALNWAIETRNDFDVVLGLHKKNVSIEGAKSVFINMETIEAFSADLQKIQPDFVIHCAGLANVEVCEADPETAYHVNVVLSVNVATACKAARISFIYIATDHLFTGVNALVSEEEIPCPVNEYGKTKLEGERRILEIDNGNLSIRTNFYGWGTSYRQSFSDIIIQNARNNKPLFLFDDFFYTPILIADLAQTTMQLCSGKACGIFNVAGQDRISKYEFGIKLADRFLLDKNLINASKFSGRKDLVKRPADLSLSNSKTTNFLNRPFGNIDENILRLYQQEQSSVCKKLVNL